MTYAYINSQLSADQVEEYLDSDQRFNKNKIEFFIPEMIKEGFEMEIFE